MSYIFISYARENRDYVDRLAKDCERFGYTVWYDKEIEIGDQWEKRIFEKIRNCGAFIIIMSIESDTSKWVRREMLVADEADKPALPLLLSGKRFDFYVDTQYTELSEKRNYLPPLDFYKTLKNYVDRKSNEEALKKESPKKDFDNFRRTYKPEKYLLKMSDWQDFFLSGSNDFYGIAMLALAFEERKEHKRAMLLMQKAHKLEPRIKDRMWMTNHYGWEEEHHRLLEAIISDPQFWQFRLSY